MGHKGNKQWVWLALDKESKEIVGVYLGERSSEGAQGLWDSLPAVYRQCAVSYTDFWEGRDFPSDATSCCGQGDGKNEFD